MISALILLLGLALPVLIGYFLLRLCLPGKGGDRLWTIWMVFLSPLVGFAIHSISYYAWSVFFSPDASILVYISSESFILLALIALSWRRRAPTSEENTAPPPSPVARYLALAATAIFVLLLVNYLEDWLRASLATPFGDWDAWAIWNLRASFIASGEDWLSGFSEALAWSHPDYPLLLPLNIARLWVLLDSRSVWVPILVSLVFQISLVGILITSVQLLRGYLQGMLAGIIGTLVLFTSLSFKLYADLPLAAFFLGANVLIFLSESGSRSSKPLALLSGLFSGAAVWTKNEGWAFLAATVIVKLTVEFFTRKSRPGSKAWWGWFLLGIAPPLIAALHLKLFFAPPGDLIQNLSPGSMLTALTSTARYATILKSAANHLLDYGQLAIPLMPLLLVYGLLMGLSIPREQKIAALSLALRLSLLAGIYFLVYLFTPKDLVWHVGTSMERLITQLFPSFTLLFFVVVAAPGRDQHLET